MLEGVEKVPKRAIQGKWHFLKYNFLIAYQTTLGAEARLLSVGRVLVNDSQLNTVTVQPYRGCWSNLQVIHKPQYQTREGYLDQPQAELAKESVPYSSIRFQVELLAGGNFAYDSVTRLRKGN